MYSIVALRRRRRGPGEVQHISHVFSAIYSSLKTAHARSSAQTTTCPQLCGSSDVWWRPSRSRYSTTTRQTPCIGCEQESGLRLNFAYWCTRQLTDTHHLISRIYACLLQLFPHVPSSALQLVETLSSLVPDDVSATGHFASPVLQREQLAVRHSNCFFCDNFQESTQDSFIYPVILHNIISSVRCCTAPL